MFFSLVRVPAGIPSDHCVTFGMESGMDGMVESAKKVLWMPSKNFFYKYLIGMGEGSGSINASMCLKPLSVFKEGFI